MSKILVIGGQNIDINAKGDTHIMHESNLGNISFAYGGVSGNVVQNLAHLGVDVTFMTVFGNDTFGDNAKAYYKSLGVDISLSKDTNHPNNTYLSVLDQNSDLLIAVNDMRSMEALDREHIKQYQSLIEAFDVVFIDTNLSEDTLACLFKEIHLNYVIIDAVSGLKVTKLKPYIEHISCLKCTIEEAAKLSDIGPLDLKEKGLTELIITNKNQPVTYFSNNHQKEYTPYPIIDIVGSSGAGDAFISGFIYGKLQQAPIDQAMDYALRAAYQTLLVKESVNKDLKL